MRTALGEALTLITALAMAGCGQEAAQPPTSEVQSDAPGPTWAVRLDSGSSDPADFVLSVDDDGVRVRTGPAGIAYRDVDVVSAGDLDARATFTLFGAPVGYREAYGIFVGGIDLDGPDLEYTYLLIRPTGDFLVKRRVGAITETLVDWTPHPAVLAVHAEGDTPVNTLSIDVFEGETHFAVNGDVVHVEAASRVRPYGVAGIRVNHRLDVRVDGWTLEGEATAP